MPAYRERIAKEGADQKQRLVTEALDHDRRSIEERKRLINGGEVKGAEQLIASQTCEQVRDAYAQSQAEENAGAWDRSGASADKVAQQRKRALEMARREFDKGQADPAEIREAQVQLASRAADTAVQQGKAFTETASPKHHQTRCLAVSRPSVAYHHHS